MTHFNQFYADLRTIDYGLLCVDLYHLAHLPVIDISPPDAKETKWSSGFEIGSEEDEKAAIERLREIANMPVAGHQWPYTVSKVEIVETVTADWDNAIWVEYYRTDFGVGYFSSAFDNKWMEKEPSQTHIQGPLGDIIALPEDKIQVYLKLLFDLASQLSGSSTGFWNAIGEVAKFSEEPLWWSLRHFEAFHRYISRDFITSNYPPFDKKDKLYFGRKFLSRYDLLISKKIDLISYFISKVSEITGVTLKIIPQNIIDGQDYWKDKNNNFNSMPLSDVKKFFTLLTTINKSGQPFLEKKDVDKFIRRAFIKERDIEKLTLNVPRGEIGKVCGLFYTYYHHCSSRSYLMKGKEEQRDLSQENYIELLTENFNDFTFQKIKPHFRGERKWELPSGFL